MKRIFSGVQPTGNLHLGNYLGAIRNFARLQNDYECIYCVVDMHSITMWQDPAELHANTREVTAAYLAAGINPENHIIFNQSQVPAHMGLAWIFNCIARIGWLRRYKFCLNFEYANKQTCRQNDTLERACGFPTVV